MQKKLIKKFHYICNMKEELTTAMHSEFSVSASTEKKHAVWVIMDNAKTKDEVIEAVRNSVVSFADFNNFCSTYPKPHELKKTGI